MNAIGILITTNEHIINIEIQTIKKGHLSKKHPIIKIH